MRNTISYNVIKILIINWQSISITNLDIADGIIVCKFNKPCEVEITKLGLRSTTSQLNSDRHQLNVVLNQGLE
jgi:hypothetical protein